MNWAHSICNKDTQQTGLLLMQSPRSESVPFLTLSIKGRSDAVWMKCWMIPWFGSCWSDYRCLWFSFNYSCILFRVGCGLFLLLILAINSLLYSLAFIQISSHRVQVNIYCKKNMTKLLSSDQEMNVIIPAESLVRSLDRPEIQHVLKRLNVTAYGVQVRQWRTGIAALWRNQN